MTECIRQRNCIKFSMGKFWSKCSTTASNMSAPHWRARHIKTSHSKPEVGISTGSMHSILTEDLCMSAKLACWRSISSNSARKSLGFQCGKEPEFTRCEVGRVGSLSNKWCAVVNQESLMQYLCSMRSVILRDKRKSDERTGVTIGNKCGAKHFHSGSVVSPRTQRILSTQLKLWRGNIK